MDFDIGIKEAEIYRSMGLLQESLSVYDEILATLSKQETGRREIILKTVEVLKKEIESQESHIPEISAEDISVIQEAVVVDDQSGILENAMAFKQLGLINEAVTEYERLFQPDYPIIKIIPDFVECLLKLVYPDEAAERALRTVGQIEP